MGTKQAAIETVNLFRTISLSCSLQVYKCQFIETVSHLVLSADSLYCLYQTSFYRQLIMETDCFACPLPSAYNRSWRFCLLTIFAHISCPLLHILVAFNWRVMELSLLFVNCLLEVIYGQFLEQPSLNAWTRVASRLAPLLDEGVASSSVNFSLIYNSPPPPFLLFHLCSFLERESVTLTPLIYRVCCPCCCRRFQTHLLRHNCKFSFCFIFHSIQLIS